MPAATAAPRPIVVTASRPIGPELFQVDAIAPTACQLAAPALGQPQPTTAVDGKTLKSVAAIEKLRKRFRAGTIFIAGGRFVGERFGKAVLRDVCFFGTDFSQSDWRGFVGSGLGFVGTDLSGAQMAGARIPFVLFRDATLANVDATGADFSRGRLDGGWGGSLHNLKLDRAVMNGFRFECGITKIDGCPIDRVGLSIKGADLTKARLYSFLFPELDMTDTVIDSTELGLDHLGRIRTAKLAGPVIVRSKRQAAMLFPAEALLLVTPAANATGNGTEAAAACAKPATPIAAAICAVPGSEMTTLLADVAQLERDNQAQRNYADGLARWTRSRDNCLKRDDDDRGECLLVAYRERRRQLIGSGVVPGWMQQPGFLLFVSDDAAFSDLNDRDLFDKLRPVLLDSARSVLMLSVGRDGVVAAKGHAGAACALAEDGLRFDRASGALAELAGRATFGQPALRVSGERLSVTPEKLSQLACDVEEGGFKPLRRVRIDAASLADLWTRL